MRIRSRLTAVVAGLWSVLAGAFASRRRAPAPSLEIVGEIEELEAAAVQKRED